MEGNTSVYVQYTVQVNERSKVQYSLKEMGIPTSVHYLTLLNDQLALRKLKSKQIKAEQTPVAQETSKRVLSYLCIRGLAMQSKTT